MALCIITKAASSGTVIWPMITQRPHRIRFGHKCSDPQTHTLLQVLSSCRILSAPVVSDGGDGDYQVCSLRLMSCSVWLLQLPISWPHPLLAYDALHTALAHWVACSPPCSQRQELLRTVLRLLLPHLILYSGVMNQLAPPSDCLLRVIVPEGCAGVHCWLVLLCLQSPCDPSYPDQHLHRFAFTVSPATAGHGGLRAPDHIRASC